MDITSLVSAGSVSLLVLEGLKWLIRFGVKLFGKEPKQIDFSPAVYAIAIPVLNILVVPLLALVGFEGFVMPTDWHGWALSAVRVAIGSLISFAGYATGLKPLKDYNKVYQASKQAVTGDGYPGMDETQ